MCNGQVPCHPPQRATVEEDSQTHTHTWAHCLNLHLNISSSVIAFTEAMAGTHDWYLKKGERKGGREGKREGWRGE